MRKRRRRRSKRNVKGSGGGEGKGKKEISLPETDLGSLCSLLSFCSYQACIVCIPISLLQGICLSVCLYITAVTNGPGQGVLLALFLFAVTFVRLLGFLVCIPLTIPFSFFLLSLYFPLLRSLVFFPDELKQKRGGGRYNLAGMFAWTKEPRIAPGDRDHSLFC